MKKFILSLVIVPTLVGILTGCKIKFDQTPIAVKNIDLIPITAKDSIHNKKMHNLIAKYKTQKDESMNIVIGQAAKDHRSELPESPLTNLIADMMLTEARKTVHADMAITNFGGIRRDLFAGDITIGNIYEILPFDNALLVLDYKGRDVLALADAIANKGGESISGMTLTIDKEGNAYDVKINGEPIDPEKIYSIVSTDYLSYGNDQLEPLNRYIKSTPLRLMMRDAMINCVKDATEKGEKINCNIDNRITIK